LTDQQLNATIEKPYSTPPSLLSLRVAIVHDWFYTRGGAERVVEVLADVFPQADLFALFARPETMSPQLRNRKITTSWLQNIPWIHRFHRHTLAFHPVALEQFDLSGYDLVISSAAGSVKGVITSPNTLHVCYCHSPMRYIWDMHSAYLREMSPISRFTFALTAHWIRVWDQSSASRVDCFVCNSGYIGSRIRKYYRRESEVIYPPVDVRSIKIDDQQEDYYIAVGRLVNYKRFDLAIEACNHLGRNLKIIGLGPDLRRLQRLAGPHIEFIGAVSDARKHEILGRCRALLFPGEEDFGIVPVEAQAHGRPVIAFGAGGALETVRSLDDPQYRNRPTGIFFLEQTADSLAGAIKRFEEASGLFNPIIIREHAMQFDESIFRARLVEFLERKLRR
jgi:glycosyltransferase involved in cell wall biosynthesis